MTRDHERAQAAQIIIDLVQTRAIDDVIRTARSILRGCDCEYDYRCSNCSQIVTLHDKLKRLDEIDAMNLPNVKELVSDNKRVKFLRYQDSNLWYECEGGFQFPVPISDAEGATFLPEDKALVFMRWIRRHIMFLTDAVIEEKVIHVK